VAGLRGPCKRWPATWGGGPRQHGGTDGLHVVLCCAGCFPDRHENRDAPAAARRPRCDGRGRSTGRALARGFALVRYLPGQEAADWLVAAETELVERHGCEARTVARIDRRCGALARPPGPVQLDSEPQWEKKRGGRRAEKSPLYGVPFVVDSKVPYGRIDRRRHREPFIRYAAVGGGLADQPPVFAENRRLLARSRGGGAPGTPPQAWSRAKTSCFAFYAARIPADVGYAQHFDTGGSKPAGPTRACSSSRPDLSTTDVRRGSAGYPDVCETSEVGRSAPRPRFLRLRGGPTPPGGQRVRRRDRRHPAERVNQVNPANSPGSGPGCDRAGHRDDPVADQGAARALCCMRRT